MGIAFQNLQLLEDALTHPSFANENPGTAHNERLEFLGDAVLEFIAGDWLYHRFPDLREGQLTQLRAELVRTEVLAQFALACGLDAWVRLGRGEDRNDGRRRVTLLCDVFEALVGAMFLDAGVEAARVFVLPLFEPALHESLGKMSTKDAKTRLQEWSQAQAGRHIPRYRNLHSSGPDHRRTFLFEVEINNILVGWGSGRSKRKAQQAAAQNALDTLGVNHQS